MPLRLRDLSPRRTMGRKVSEAVRALALDADHDPPLPVVE